VSGTIRVVCLGCQYSFKLEHPPVRDVIITCPHCGVELEITNVEPLELDFYFESDCQEYEEWSSFRSSNDPVFS
jgi:lysine biosynthesis protein LysW